MPMCSPKEHPSICKGDVFFFLIQEKRARESHFFHTFAIFRFSVSYI